MVRSRPAATGHIATNVLLHARSTPFLASRFYSHEVLPVLVSAVRLPTSSPDTVTGTSTQSPFLMFCTTKFAGGQNPDALSVIAVTDPLIVHRGLEVDLGKSGPSLAKQVQNPLIFLELGSQMTISFSLELVRPGIFCSQNPRPLAILHSHRPSDIVRMSSSNSYIYTRHIVMVRRREKLSRGLIHS